MLSSTNRTPSSKPLEIKDADVERITVLLFICDSFLFDHSVKTHTHCVAALVIFSQFLTNFTPWSDLKGQSHYHAPQTMWLLRTVNHLAPGQDLFKSFPKIVRLLTRIAGLRYIHVISTKASTILSVSVFSYLLHPGNFFVMLWLQSSFEVSTHKGIRCQLDPHSPVLVLRQLIQLIIAPPTSKVKVERVGVPVSLSYEWTNATLNVRQRGV